jgi:hypothetical protein
MNVATQDELTDAVVAILAKRGIDVDPATVRIARSPHGSSCHLYDVEIAGGSLPPLLLKDLSPAALLPEAIGVRPAHLYDPHREPFVYRSILAPASIGPTLYGTRIVPEEHRFLLLIEKVNADALDYIGEFSIWRSAARWIGSMHARFLRAPLDEHQRRPLLRVDGGELRYWLDRAERVARAAGDARLDAIAPHVDRFADELDALPSTFIHGELFASNILVDTDGRVCPVDWELAALGPGAVDIAALTAGGWSDRERAALVDEYAIGAGIGASDRSRLERAVELARLYLALRLVGWAERWVPPADEQHDWLAEATGAFSRLEGTARPRTDSR